MPIPENLEHIPAERFNYRLIPIAAEDGLTKVQLDGDLLVLEPPTSKDDGVRYIRFEIGEEQVNELLIPADYTSMEIPLGWFREQMVDGLVAKVSIWRYMITCMVSGPYPTDPYEIYKTREEFNLLDSDTPIPVTLPGQQLGKRSKENELVYEVTVGEGGNLVFSLPTNIIAPKGLGAVTVVSQNS